MNKIVARMVAGAIPFKRIRHAVREALLRETNIHWVPCIAKRFGGDFKAYLLANDIPTKAARLKANLDDRSREIVDVLLARMAAFPSEEMARAFSLTSAGDALVDATATLEERELRAYRLNDFRRTPLAKISLDSLMEVDVFYHHHGLRTAPTAVRDYVAGGDFMDVGAGSGDSAILFHLMYRPGKIYSFEISDPHLQGYARTMRANRVPAAAYELVNKAVSNRMGEVPCASVYDYLSTAPNLKADSRAAATTLDAFVAERGLRPTFIKADVEGGEAQCVEGMSATVQKFRPVLSICIYHTPEQFFDLKPRLEEMTRDLQYRYEIKLGTEHFEGFHEFMVFAYPSELAKKA